MQLYYLEFPNSDLCNLYLDVTSEGSENQGLPATECIIIPPKNNRKQRFTAKAQCRVTSGQQFENLLCGKVWFSQGGKIKCQIKDSLLDN